MARLLTKLRVNEVSSVDRGAGEGVRIVLTKRADDTDPYDLTKRDYSDDQRKEMAQRGEAMPGGGFPIANKADLHNAIQAFGRAKNPAEAKRHIIARARALGATDELPEGWTVSKGWIARVLAKVGIGKAMDFDDAQQAIEVGEYCTGMMQEFEEAMSALRASVCSIMQDNALQQKQAALDETFDQFREHIGTVVPEQMEKALTGAAEATAGLIAKRADMTDAEKKAEEERKAKEREHEDTKKALDVAKREIAVLKMSEKHKEYHETLDGEEKGKFAGMTPAERDEHMDKHPVKKTALPADVQKRLDEFEAMQKRVAALESGNALVGFQKRAVEIGIGEAHGVTLQKAYAGDKAAVDQILTLVKASTEQAKAAGLFKEFGAGGGTGGDATAYDQIKAKAAELRKADPKMSEAQAFARAYADPANAEMAKRERAENRPSAA